MLYNQSEQSSYVFLFNVPLRVNGRIYLGNLLLFVFPSDWFSFGNSRGADIEGKPYSVTLQGYSVPQSHEMIPTFLIY